VRSPYGLDGAQYLIMWQPFANGVLQFLLSPRQLFALLRGVRSWGVRWHWQA